MEENDLDDPKFQKRMDGLRREVSFDLDGAHSDTTKRQKYTDYHDAYFFRYTGGGLSWSIGVIIESRPTLNEKSSLSRSLGHLIKRELVQRSSVFNDYVVLTPLGRSVCKRLTPC